MSNLWQYNGRELRDEDIVPGSMGFIYLITQLSTGKFYIGRKLLTSASSKMVNGKKKKVRKESDWKNYWSSSPKIKQWIEDAGGTADFTKEIISFCQSKGSLAYSEELALYSVGALESDKWINDNIRSKIYRSWVKLDDAKQLRAALKKLKFT